MGHLQSKSPEIDILGFVFDVRFMCLTQQGPVNVNQKTPKTSKMHYRETTVIDDDECAALVGTLGQYLTNGNVCTSNPVEQGVCTADSGGPMVCSENFLKGILSWNGNCMAGKPDVYTEICAYEKWIAAEMAKK